MIKKDDQALIAAFVANKPTFEAVKRVLLAGMIGDNFTKVNWVYNLNKDLSDAAYGREVKMTRKAIEWIEGAFEEMLLFAPRNPQPEQKNQAR